MMTRHMLPEWGSPTESMALFSSKRSKITVPWWFSTWHSVVHSLSLGISQLLVLFLINRELRCVFPGPWCGSGHITACCTPAVCIRSLGSPCTLSLHTGRVAPLGHRTSMRGKNEFALRVETPKWYSQKKLCVRNKPTSSKGIELKNITLLRRIILIVMFKIKMVIQVTNEAENFTF